MKGFLSFPFLIGSIKALTISSFEIQNINISGHISSFPDRNTFKRDEQEQISASWTNTSFSDLSNQEAIYELDRLYMLLISFIHEILFYDVEFDRRAEIISKNLDELVFLIGNVDKRVNEIMERLTHIKALFRIMTEASAYLKYYQVRGTDQQLVRQIIQFNVGLLLFFDVRGSPDVSMPGYITCINNFPRIFESWKIIFLHLENVPLGIGSMFETESRKATYLLEFLRKTYFDNGAHSSKNFLTDYITSFSKELLYMPEKSQMDTDSTK